MRYIPGYEGEYSVDTQGNVYSHKSNVYLKNHLTRRGYHSVHLGRKAKLVHRLVGLTYLPNPESKPNINHINGVQTDNRLENLEWCTHRENAIHARDVLGVKFNLSGAANRKLTMNQAKEIRALKGKYLYREIAEMFGTDKGTVTHIMTNRTYRQLSQSNKGGKQS